MISGDDQDYMVKHVLNPQTNAVLLREVTEADLPIFFAHQLDPDATRMAAFPSRNRDAFMAHWAKILADETIIKKTVLFNGQVAGNMVSFEQEGKPHVGYWLGKEFWGKGIATRALTAFLGHIAKRPLYAHVAKGNLASLRVLEKCGFAVVGESQGAINTGGDEVAEFILELSASESE